MNAVHVFGSGKLLADPYPRALHLELDPPGAPA